MVGQVTIAPDGLRDAQDHAQQEGKEAVGPARPEERRVNEIMGGGIRIPPETEGNQAHGGNGPEQKRLEQGQADKQPIPIRVTQSEMS